MYQVMNLEDHEVEWLCAHLGHDLDIHKDYYRNMSSLGEGLLNQNAVNSREQSYGPISRTKLEDN